MIKTKFKFNSLIVQFNSLKIWLALIKKEKADFKIYKEKLMIVYKRKHQL